MRVLSLKPLLLSLILAVAIQPLYAIGATQASQLEQLLTDALRYDSVKAKRIGDSGKAIQAYMRAGIVNKKPNVRTDYTDYYLT
jgi:hypothetical protein